MVRNLIRDCRYGLRALHKNPSTTIIAVLALALGIGANTAIYSVVDTVLLHPVPFPHLEQLVVISGLLPGATEESLAYPADFEAWRAQRDIFREVSAVRQRQLTLTGIGEPAAVAAEEVSANYFKLLGVQPLLGRTFSATEDVSGSEQVAVLGERLWQQRFNGEKGALGKSVVLNNIPYSVIGVVSDEKLWPDHQSQIWIPLVLNKTFQARYLRILGRMQPGVNASRAQDRAQAATKQAEMSYPELEKGRSIRVQGLNEEIVRGVRSAILTLWAAVAFVLLIACANVANILLARIMAREREIAVRRALGASRWGMVQQFLTEGVMLALVGGAIGLFLAELGIKLLVKFGPGNIPRLADVGIDASVLVFAVVMSLLTGIVFGLAPALRASTMDVNGLLKEGSANVTGSKIKIRLRDALVISEVLLAMVLLVAAGLMINSFHKLQTRELGFDPKNVLTLRLNLSGSQYSATDKKIAFFRELEAQLSNAPGIVSTGLTASLPTDRLVPDTDVMVVGHPVAKENMPKAAIQVIGGSYFTAMHIPLKAGRIFSEAEMENSLPRIVINESLAASLFPGEDPIGKQLVLGEDEDHPNEIIGVVGDVNRLDTISSAVPVVFYPYPRLPFPSMAVIVRTASNNPQAMADGLARQIHAVDVNEPIAEVSTMENLVTGSVSRPRFISLLLGIFAFLALTLASIGIYGIVSYSVGQSTREIGVRMALGADRSAVLRTMLMKGIVPVIYGIAGGLAVSLLLTRFMTSLLFKVDPYDPLTFIAVSMLLSAIALVASYVPARRATKVDPLNALRYE